MTKIIALDLIWNMWADKLGWMRFYVMCITCLYKCVCVCLANCACFIASDGLETRNMKYTNEELDTAGIKCYSYMVAAHGSSSFHLVYDWCTLQRRTLFRKAELRFSV